jgi:hypothetical protein
MSSQVLLVQLSTSLEVCHMRLTQKAKSLGQVRENMEIWCPVTSLPGFLMARQSSLMMLSVRSQSMFSEVILVVVEGFRCSLAEEKDSL